MNPLALAAWASAFFLSATLFSHTVALRLLLLVAGTALAITALAAHRERLRPLPPVWLAFALWAGWAALSLAWSYEPERTLKELRNEAGYAAMALWMCYIGAQAREAPRILLPVVVASASVVSALALYWFFLEPARYPFGAHGGAGNLSSALLTLMPCALMAGWYAAQAPWPRVLQWLIWALPGLFFISAYTTLNRTVWLGFGAQLILIGVLLLARRPRAQAPRAALRTRLSVALIAVAIVSGAVTMTLRIQAEREALAAAQALDADPRFGLWPAIVERIGERPLTGYGFGRGILRASLSEELKDPFLWHAHNLLLEVALQVGLPGVLLLLYLLAAIVREGWKGAFARDPRAAACGIALIAVTAGMLVRNMTDMLWVRQNALLYWGVVAVLLAWGERYRAAARR
jgi:O-antigen ligase